MGGFPGTPTPTEASFAWWRGGYITGSQCRAKEPLTGVCERKPVESI
jgi:hypothetical protein